MLLQCFKNIILFAEITLVYYRTPENYSNALTIPTVTNKWEMYNFYPIHFHADIQRYILFFGRGISVTSIDLRGFGGYNLGGMG